MSWFSMTQHSLITQTPAKSGALQTCISLMTVMRIGLLVKRYPQDCLGVKILVVSVDSLCMDALLRHE